MLFTRVNPLPWLLCLFAHANIYLGPFNHEIVYETLKCIPAPFNITLLPSFIYADIVIWWHHCNRRCGNKSGTVACSYYLGLFWNNRRVLDCCHWGAFPSILHDMKDTALLCVQCCVSVSEDQVNPWVVSPRALQGAWSCVSPSFIFNGYGWCEAVPDWYKKKFWEKELQTHLTDGSSALSGAEVKGPLRGAEEAIKGLQRQ